MAAIVAVDGLRELVRAIGKARDQDLGKRFGEANKRTGAMVIVRLQPRPDPVAVGEGAGAAVRPSATKRQVVLRVGGSHRKKSPLSVWGKRRVSSFGRTRPPRPFIQGTVDRHQRDIEDFYLDAVHKALDPAFGR